MALALVNPSPASATFTDQLFDNKGRNVGYYMWESLHDDVVLVNRKGRVPNIRLIVNVQVDDRWYKYKDVMVSDNHSVKYRLYLPKDAQTVRVRACFYNAKGAKLGACRQRYDTRP